MQEKRIFFTRMHPRKHAQEAIFPVIYSVFLHISNTDFDPQKSANHRAPPPPPMATAEKTTHVSNAFRHHPGANLVLAGVLVVLLVVLFRFSLS